MTIAITDAPMPPKGSLLAEELEAAAKRMQPGDTALVSSWVGKRGVTPSAQNRAVTVRRAIKRLELSLKPHIRGEDVFVEKLGPVEPDGIKGLIFAHDCDVSECTCTWAEASACPTHDRPAHTFFEEPQ